MPESSRRAAVVLGAAGLAVLLAAQPAGAVFTRSASASMPVTSGRLVAATGPSAAAGCTLLVPRITLSWTPTVTLSATGYRIYRRVGAGSFSLHATVAGRNASSHVDPALALATSYGYYVEAYVGSWTAATATVSATTPVLCL